MIYFLIFVCFIVFVLFIRFCNFKSLVRGFQLENYAIGGLRGTGKDLLMSNALARYKNIDSYISNVDYKLKGKNFIPFNALNFDIKNNYDNFLTNNINKYVYPYNDKIPIYVSDAQLYFPSAYESDLKKKYSGLVNFMPLSRHLGNTQMIVNSQAFNLVWDKIRVQCDRYILCMSCSYIFGFVFMNVRIYENYDSFIGRVPPYRKPINLLSNKKKVDIDLHKVSYDATYGIIKRKKLFFINKSHYDSRFMKGVLENGK